MRAGNLVFNLQSRAQPCQGNEHAASKRACLVRVLVQRARFAELRLRFLLCCRTLLARSEDSESSAWEARGGASTLFVGQEADTQPVAAPFF